jgi:DNA modification methylase
MEFNHIHRGDTLEFLKTIPDQSADLIIADPPYSVFKDFGEPTVHRELDEWVEWSQAWLDQCVRILSPLGNLFVYSIHHTACYLQVHLYEQGMVYRRQIIWYYENGWSRYVNGPACNYEPILWFANSEKSTFHEIREPYKSAERLRYPVRKNGKTWQPHPEGRLAGDVWHIPTLAGRRFAKEKVAHPTQKPLSLSRRLVQHFSNPGDLVLIPFVGSGSECVAARELSRNFVGAEINEEYVRLAESRLCELQSQTI